MTASYSGLELCYYAFKDQLVRDADLVVLFVHWYLVKHGFHCVVNGKITEILPVDWNASEEIYSINYTLESKGYELKVLPAEDGLIINLYKKSNERTANFQCKPRDHVTGLNREFQNIFVNLQDLYDQINKEFMPLFKENGPKSEERKLVIENLPTSSNPQPSPYEPDPLRVTRPDLQPMYPDYYGRSDLDPFQFDPSSRGGMIFDPFRNPDRNRFVPGNLPPGAVPPGARFDPYGPPNPEDLRPSRVGPNPSHLRPPQFDPSGFL